MIVPYQELVNQAKEFISKKITSSNFFSSSDETETIYFTASLFGIQKIVDLLNWLKESQQNNISLPAELAEQLRQKLFEIVNSWVASPPYGEFVKDGLIALRPLYQKNIEISSLTQEFSKLIQSNWDKRISFCLPVVYHAHFPYALRIPSKYLKQGNKDYNLSLAYIDWNQQPNNLTWLGAINILRRWEKSGDLVYHGALEVPVNRLLERRNILPYYVVLRLKGLSSEDFLKNHEVLGHSLKILSSQESSFEEEILPSEDFPSLLKKAAQKRITRGKITQIEQSKEEHLASVNLENKELQELSLIPFRIEDLSNPEFPWPVS
jgi:hypothetical protein